MSILLCKLNLLLISVCVHVFSVFRLQIDKEGKLMGTIYRRNCLMDKHEMYFKTIHNYM